MHIFYIYNLSDQLHKNISPLHSNCHMQFNNIT